LVSGEDNIEIEVTEIVNKVREGYKITEVGEIPEEWEVKKLQQVFEICQYGISNSLSDEGKYPVLRMNNIKKGKVILDNFKFINLDENEFNKYSLNRNDILFNRTNSIDLVGKTGIYDSDEVATFASYLIRIKTNNKIAESKFVNYYMNSNKGQERIRLFATLGVSQANINAENLKKVLIPIAPIQEQQKISLILSCIDEKIENTDNLIEKTKELKKGLMQRLLTKGIGHDRFKDTEIGRIPDGWEIKKFKDVSKVSQGLQIAIENRFKEPSLNCLPYITIQYINDKNNYDNQYYIENASESVICNTDDILMTRTGNTGVVVTNEHGIFHNNFFKVDYNRHILDRDFLVYYLKSKPLQSLILRYAGTTTIPDLNHGDFYRIPVVLPSIKEQEQIASILLSVDEKIDQYESKKEKLQELKKGLMQKLLIGKIRVKA
jgi:type I restriction enzyme S subunit